MSMQSLSIPSSLQPYFQEYDLADLRLYRDANLIIQRTLEYGTWDEVRWLFQVYSRQRIQRFLREHGERWLKPVTFNYWRKLLRIRHWQPAPFGKGELWNPLSYPHWEALTHATPRAFHQVERLSLADFYRMCACFAMATRTMN